LINFGLQIKEKGRRMAMSFWGKIKKDIQKGFQEGMLLAKEGVTVVKEKVGDLTEEGKKKYKLYALKARVQKEIAELGGKIYELSSKVRNPMTDKKVKDIVAKIKKLEDQILTLEGKIKKVTPKKAATRKTTRKTTTRKTRTTTKAAAKTKASSSRGRRRSRSK